MLVIRSSANGNVTVSLFYSYETWDKLISTIGSLVSTLGEDNLIRYRGYYYDVEIGLYYLQNRNYDPNTGRFINTDDVAFLGATGMVLSHNLFAYCENNPVNRGDNAASWSCAIIAGVSGLVFGGIAYLVCKALGISGWKLAAFTTAFIGVGIVIGLIWESQVLRTINKLTKPHYIFLLESGQSIL